MSSSAKNLHQLLFGVRVCLILAWIVDFIGYDW
ncbi:putative membrane protein, partial [Yersinia pestis PY-89]